MQCDDIATVLLFYLTGALRCTQEYSTYRTAATIIVGGKRAVTEGNHLIIRRMQTGGATNGGSVS